MSTRRPAGFPASIPEDVSVRPIDLDAEEFYVGGVRLTENRAAQFAERAERTARGGRPSLSGPGRQSPSISLRLPEHTKDRLDDLARTEGRRQSEIIRTAVDEYLERHAS